MSATTICPTCGEETGARWHRLRDVPGAGPAYKLSHRRAGGARCETIRGEWLPGANICTPGGDGATIGGSESRSVRAEERATA